MMFNLRTLQTKTKIMTDIIRDFLFVLISSRTFCLPTTAEARRPDMTFAVDWVLKTNYLSISEADMHCSIDKFSTACTNFGLTISTKKTEPQENHTLSPTLQSVARD